MLLVIDSLLDLLPLITTCWVLSVKKLIIQLITIGGISNFCSFSISIKLLPSDWNDNILSEIASANARVGGKILNEKLIDLLDKRGLIPETYETNKQVKANKYIDPKYNFLREGHSHPKNVEMHDLETDKVDLYPSI